MIENYYLKLFKVANKASQQIYLNRRNFVKFAPTNFRISQKA
jgi:hypothetical protein